MLEEVLRRLKADSEVKSARIRTIHGVRCIEAKLESPHSDRAGGGRFSRTRYYDADGCVMDKPVKGS